MILDRFKLDGKVAVVTGAGRGIGQAYALGLAEAGADIAVVDVIPMDETLDAVKALGRRAIGIKADLAKGEKEAPKIVAKVVKALGRVDILVNNAGIIRREPFLEHSAKNWNDVISINRKIEDAVALNQKQEHNNNTDRFANFMFSLPVLPTLLVGLVKLLDRLGLLPRFVIDLSPFHTSLFITNLASINTEAIYHHCYEFGTTGVFVCMGKPVPNFLTGEYNKKIMPLGIVMDERICTGHEYALFWQTLRRYLKHPELTENGAEERAEMPEAVEA